MKNETKTIMDLCDNVVVEPKATEELELINEEENQKDSQVLVNSRLSEIYKSKILDLESELKDISEQFEPIKLRNAKLEGLNSYLSEMVSKCGYSYVKGLELSLTQIETLIAEAISIVDNSDISIKDELSTVLKAIESLATKKSVVDAKIDDLTGYAPLKINGLNPEIISQNNIEISDTDSCSIKELLKSGVLSTLKD